MDYPMFTGLMVGVPLSGRPLVPEFTWSFMNLHPPMNTNLRYATITGHPVDVARNWIVEQAKNEKAQYLFFVDEDVTIPSHAVRQLLFHMEHNPDIGVIGGIVCHKAKPNAPMVFRGNGRGPYWDWKVGELFEITGIGMGCTLIRMSVFDEIEKPYFNTVDSTDLFLEGINKAEQWTEDLSFCDQITKKTKWKIYADGSILCDHWNPITRQKFSLEPNSNPLRKLNFNGQKKIVDLGSGESPYTTDEGEVTTVDIRDSVNPDYRCDLRVLPFASNFFDIVYSSHTLEHFAKDEIPQVLKEWTRILKDDGEFRLILPNIEWAAQQLVNGVYDDDVFNVLYGAQTFNENFHKFGFTPKKLEQLLRNHGFKTFDFSYSGYNIMCRAFKILKPPVEKVKKTTKKSKKK